MLAPSYTIKGIWAAIIAGVITLLLALNIAQAVNTYADVQFKLPLGLHIGFTGWKPHALASDDKIKQMNAASAANAVAQKKAIADQKAKFDDAARIADETFQAQLAAARSAADRYKLTHRVPSPAASVGPGAAAGQTDAPAVSETAPAEADIYVSAADFDASVTDYTYARACYDWAQDLVTKGAAEFKGP